VLNNKSKKIVVTHNGSFHSDEIFAVATLELMLGKDFEIEILRIKMILILDFPILGKMQVC